MAESDGDGEPFADGRPPARTERQPGTGRSVRQPGTGPGQLARSVTLAIAESAPVSRHPRLMPLAALVLAGLAIPAPVAAHGLVGRLDSPLPLVVYLAGAAVVVALSFAIAFAHDGRWTPSAATEIRRVPRLLVLLLRVTGLLAWAWVVAQSVVGGSSDAEVGSLFTWVYGWVGLAIVSALLGPVWEWLDPFATLHDGGAWLLRRLRIRGWQAARVPCPVGSLAGGHRLRRVRVARARLP